MILTWLGHSCFRLKSGNATVIVDPYAKGSVPGVELPDPIYADAVYCSHTHSDHGAADRVTLRNGGENVFAVQVFESFHDDCGGTMRGKNLIHLFSAEGMKVVHLGDIGSMPDPETIQALHGADCVLIPVGGHYTVDAAAAQSILEQLSPRVVIPMHYRSARFGFDVISTVDPFLALRADTVFCGSNSFTLTADTPSQTAVLDCG